MAFDGLRLAGQDRLVEREGVGAHEPAVRDDLVAWSQAHEVADHELADTDPPRTTLAHHRTVGETSAASRSSARLARTSRVIPMAEFEIRTPRKSVPPVGEDQREHSEDEQDQVEDGEDVRSDDAGVRPAGLRLGQRAPSGKPARGLPLGQAGR